MLTDRMKELRKSLGMSQRDLAGRLAVRQQTVAKWELGGATPNPEMLSTIADVFGVSVDYLIGRDETRLSKNALKFALFDGAPLDDAALEEVMRFAEFTKEKYKQ